MGSRILNLGILAHVDAGKTSLTERLLHAAGVIDELGSVEDGSTQTDSLDLEPRRGITIRSAVVSFAIDDVTVNLIDTPGHPDFIAEVERVLGVLDGAVLVVSAVEGVQAQTRILLRTLRRLRIPTIVFINRTDRRGADPDRVLGQLPVRLAPAWKDVVGVLAEHDDELLAAFVEGRPVPAAEVRASLARLLSRPGRLEGDVPAAHVHGLQQALPGLTRGEGVLEYDFDRYEPVRGPVPDRPRTGPDPLDRKEYLLQVVRRTPAG
ncbi:GTP-binding protein [Dactylosporangium sp. AC04546]|uniref:GTP-binding protein n=1 Tax=Dactylosporangium sp. AC04546 TaxID=2862460 RepID=UPI0027DF86C2|nr:GTP-binding protein [Dactylosporangium sp. AC04546]WVK80049.1 GTP-binding protein [Dactylosporangium sp. AC04546]